MPLYDPEAMIAEARRQRGQAESLATPLDARDFDWRPGEGRWSVGECLEHLALMNDIYLDALEPALAQARESGQLSGGAQKPGRHSRLGDAFVRSLEPPPGRFRGRAFARTVPAQRAKSEVLAQFLDAQDRMIRVIGSARDIDLARARMRSPFFRPLRLSIGQAFGAMLAHNRRHIWQAEGVLALLRTNPQARD